MTASATPGSSAKKRMSAANDLIRSLDQALSGMQHAASTSAEDASRARRNAKAAAELARRYGAGASKEKTLLEKKREKRAQARMAAEAKQRREHASIMLLDDKSTPYKSGGRSVSDAARAIDESTDHFSAGPFQKFGSGVKIDATIKSPTTMKRESRIEMETAESYESFSTAREERIDDMAAPSQRLKDELHVNSFPRPGTGQQNSPGRGENSHPQHYIDNAEPSTPKVKHTAREDSHAEDVLSLSLEVERLRSQLSSANYELSHTTSQLAAYKDKNEQLTIELSTVKAQLRSTQDSESQGKSSLEEKLSSEFKLRKAAEEDAQLALELAKESNTTKEECEMWLMRSLDEIDLWKTKCAEMEGELRNVRQELGLGQQNGEQQEKSEESKTSEDEAKKSVRFKDDCPPSPVRSIDGDYEERAAKQQAPPPPPPPPADTQTPWNTPQAKVQNAVPSSVSSAPTSSSSAGMFSPSTSSFSTPMSTSSSTPSKSAIASGRAYLHSHSPSLQRSSPHGGKRSASPNPHAQASELMRRSAETRRLLRERLASVGRKDSVLPRPPGTPDANSGGDEGDKQASAEANTFAARQGAACKAVAKTLRKSGRRLRLNGKWWSVPASSDGDDDLPSTQSSIELVADLESMVGDYCVNVEGTIGNQQDRIEELLAFCDHLEKDMLRR